jgi:hypothetical protein
MVTPREEQEKQEMHARMVRGMDEQREAFYAPREVFLRIAKVRHLTPLILSRYAEGVWEQMVDTYTRGTR